MKKISSLNTRLSLITLFSLVMGLSVQEAGAFAGKTSGHEKEIDEPVSTCPTVSIGNATAFNGAEITVPVEVSNLTGLGVISFDITVAYDSSIVTPTAEGAVDPVGGIASAFNFAINTSTPGRISVSAFSANSLSGTGRLFFLKFGLTGAPGQSSALTFQRLEFNEGTPCATGIPGQASVARGSVAGRVRYFAGGTPAPVPNVTLSGTGSENVSGISDSSGNFIVEGFGAGGYTLTPSKTGQVNGISSLDASRIAQHLVGLITLSSNQLIAADVTNNGDVNSFDAARIAQWLVGITSSGTNITGTWKFVPANKTFTSVNATLTGQDFIAILMGDVTGNWAPPAALTDQ